MKNVVLGSVLGATLLLLNGCGSSDDVATQTIAELAVANNLTTLVDLLTKAELVDSFGANGTFNGTVFAPSDDAFSDLDLEILECLKDPERKSTLSNLLKYHAVADDLDWPIASIGDKNHTTLLEHAILTVKVTDDEVMVNNAKIIAADVRATNGIVHVIDKVLQPPDFECVKTPSSTPSTIPSSIQV